MQIPKPTEADRERFAGLVPEAPDVEVKPMFGNLGAFVHGNMFMGLFGPDIGVRLPDEERLELLAVPGAGPFGPAERPMSGYVSLPAGFAESQASEWIDRALSYVASMPPKAPKAAKRSSAGRARKS